MPKRHRSSAPHADWPEKFPQGFYLGEGNTASGSRKILEGIRLRLWDTCLEALSAESWNFVPYTSQPYNSGTMGFYDRTCQASPECAAGGKAQTNLPKVIWKRVVGRTNTFPIHPSQSRAIGDPHAWYEGFPEEPLLHSLGNS